jgi:hypothetical protein
VSPFGTKVPTSDQYSAVTNLPTIVVAERIANWLDTR